MEILDYKIISVVGSGGKTSLIYKIAGDLKKKGKKVAITTTTKIFSNIREECVDFVSSDISEKNTKKLFLEKNVVVFGEKCSDKLTSPKEDFFEYVTKYCDYLIIEADGSKRKPLKITKENEPVIIEKTELVIAVFGLSAIGKRASEVCHRYEGDEIVDIDFFCEKIIGNTIGIPCKSVKIVLNQADNEKDVQNALKIKEKINFDDVEIVSIKRGEK